MPGNNSSKSFRYTALALKFLERILGSKITVEGLENIPNQPVLFVANHFTRSETFIVPYIIYKYSRRQVRCLADNGLFVGTLGRFLSSVGTMSTENPNRDNTIISDLISGNYDWMIYPEGSMIKNKEIIYDGGYITSTPYRVGMTRTGAAVLALKSELYRTDYVDALKKNKKDIIGFYQENYPGLDNRNYGDIETYIVPVNITYYPIRPGNNKIKALTSRFFKKLPKQVTEEVEIEGNLLLSADMNISFGKAISVGDYVKSAKSTIFQIPIIKNDTKINLVIKYLKYRLTNHFMSDIYSDTKINIDHLFSAILYHYPQENINIDYLKNLIFFSALMIVHTKQYRVRRHLEENNLAKLLSNKKHKEFDSIVKLATALSIIKLNDDKKSFFINKEKMAEKHNFHNIRLENTIQVIANEFFLLEKANDIIRRNITLGEERIREKTFNCLADMDLAIFKEDYKKYQEAGVSKDESVGMPQFFDSNHPINNKTGILLVHGYLSAPKEMEQLAIGFNKLGFRTYCVRLKGHGTAPINLREVTWQDWQDSVLRGYATLKTICQDIVLVGFSTGGLLSLMASTMVNTDVKAVISINSALKLHDVKSKLVPTINVWNDILGKFHIDKGRMEYVKSTPENPNINYSKNYLKGVEQLELLIGECEDTLEKVTAPALIIGSKDDPVVVPDSSKIVFKQIGSKIKELAEIDSDKHVIVSGKSSDQVFKLCQDFLEKLGVIKNS